MALRESSRPGGSKKVYDVSYRILQAAAQSTPMKTSKEEHLEQTPVANSIPGSSNFNVGDDVVIIQKTKETSGKIINLNPTRAQVAVFGNDGGGVYNVPSGFASDPGAWEHSGAVDDRWIRDMTETESEEENEHELLDKLEREYQLSSW